MRLKWIALILLVGAPLAVGQSCDAVVDGAGLVLPNETAVVRAAQMLVGEGADVRVRHLESSQFPTMEGQERYYEFACPSWRALDGGRKNNLIVVLLDRRSRRTGLYYGSQWKAVLDAQWPRINSQVMAPHFRDGDFALGIAAGLAEVRRLISQPPAAATVTNVNAATDFSGLWTALVGLVILLAGALLLACLFRYRAARRREQEDRGQAKEAAAIAQREASELVQECSAGVVYFDAAGHTGAKALIDGAVSTFSQIIPPAAELSAGNYRAAEVAYKGVSADLLKAKRLLRGDPEPVIHDNSAAFRHLDNGIQGAGHVRHRQGRQTEPSATVVHNHYESGPTCVPVFIPDSEPARIYSTPDPEPSSSFGESPSTDSGGGGSSDWGSSSSDSGGSSDFGSSSDSGGGGGDSSW